MAARELEAADQLQTPHLKDYLFFALAPLAGLDGRAIFNLDTRAWNEEIVFYLAMLTAQQGDTQRACALWQRHANTKRNFSFSESQRLQIAQQQRVALGCTTQPQ